MHFLKLEEVVAIHHDQVRRYGGSHGIRDLNLLMSSVSLPQASFAGEYLYPTLFAKVASLIHSLIMNHAFVDGNKRTAMTSGARFLYINGYKLKVHQKNMVETAVSIGSGKLNIELLARWVKENSRKIK
jgi:death-on-curing protein